MNGEIVFTIPGVPKAKKRPRSAVSGGRVVVYDTKSEKDIKSKILAEYLIAANKRDPQFKGGVSFKVIFSFTPPRSWSAKRRRECLGKYKASKPDVDNLCKMVMDALNGIAYKDDGQVCCVHAEKVYGEVNQTLVFMKGVELWA